MLPILLLAGLAPMAAPAQAAPDGTVYPPRPPVSGREECPRAEPRLARQPRQVRPQRLIELPPGRLELTVLREVDGCPIPAVLREGLGAASNPEGRPNR